MIHNRNKKPFLFQPIKFFFCSMLYFQFNLWCRFQHYWTRSIWKLTIFDKINLFSLYHFQLMKEILLEESSLCPDSFLILKVISDIGPYQKTKTSCYRRLMKRKLYSCRYLTFRYCCIRWQHNNFKTLWRVLICLL